MTDYPKTNGPVVVRPRHFRRRPARGLIAFVRIDGRREAVTKFGRIFHQAAENLAEDFGPAALLFTAGGAFARFPENIFSAAPQTQVYMTTAAHFTGPGLRHECDRFALLRGYFFHALLEDK